MIRKQLFAWFYSKNGKQKVLAKIREEVLRGVSGEIVEIGAGTGINLKYYPKSLTIKLVEPNHFMVKYLEKEATSNNLKISILESKGELIGIGDSSIDYVVMTLVLCSVDDVLKVLSEVKRILKPEGTYIFIEHVVSKRIWLKFIQNLITPITRFVADGCHSNRDTIKSIQDTGFSKIDYKEMDSLMPFFVPIIYGKAVK